MDCHGCEGDEGGQAASLSQGFDSPFSPTSQLLNLTAGKRIFLKFGSIEVPQSTAKTSRGAVSGSVFNPDICPTFWQAAKDKDRCGQETLNKKLYGKLIYRGKVLVPIA